MTTAITTLVIPSQILRRDVVRISVPRYDLCPQIKDICNTPVTVPPTLHDAPNPPITSIPAYWVNPFSRASAFTPCLDAPVPPIQEVTWTSHPEGFLLTIPIAFLPPSHFQIPYQARITFDDTSETIYSFPPEAPSLPTCSTIPPPYPVQQEWCDPIGHSASVFKPILCPRKKLNGVFVDLEFRSTSQPPVELGIKPTYIIGDSFTKQVKSVSNFSAEIATNDVPFRARVLGYDHSPSDVASCELLPTFEPLGNILVADQGSQPCVASIASFLRNPPGHPIYYNGFKIEVLPPVAPTITHTLVVTLSGRSSDHVVISSPGFPVQQKTLSASDPSIAIPFNARPGNLPAQKVTYFIIQSSFLTTIQGWFLADPDQLVIGAFAQCGPFFLSDSEIQKETFRVTLSRVDPEDKTSPFVLSWQDKLTPWSIDPPIPSTLPTKGVLDLTFRSSDNTNRLMFLTVLTGVLAPVDSDNISALMLLEVIE